MMFQVIESLLQADEEGFQLAETRQVHFAYGISSNSNCNYY